MDGADPLRSLDPETADALRDVLGMIRCELAGDEEGTRAFLAALDHGQARGRLRVLAEVTAELLAGVDPEWLAGPLRRI